MPSFADTAAEIAREAGTLVSRYFERRIGFELKGEHDLVTEADRASERLIVERLRTHFPSHSILAEEGGGVEASSDYRWYVDPLDGTTNFAHGFPVWNVTLALEERGELIAGVIYDPIRNEMFSSEKSAGSWLNNRRIRVSNVSRVEESLVATGFPSYKRHKNVNVHFYYQLAMISHGVRRAGAAALDLAYVACGRLEAFWEFGLKPWDVAAGILMITEAGGSCSDMRGNPASVRGPDLLADNGRIHGEMIEVFREIFAGRQRFGLPEVQG